MYTTGGRHSHAKAHDAEPVAPVRPAVIPQEPDAAPEVAEQMPQELTDLPMLDILGMKVVVQAQAATARAHRQGRDNGGVLGPNATLLAIARATPRTPAEIADIPELRA